MPTPRELACLYDAHAAELFAFLADFTGQEADAHDVLQDLFIRLARNETPLAAIENVRAYLFRLARNLAVDSFRRRDVGRRKHAALELEMAPHAFAEPALDEPALNRAIERALAELPPEQRAVVHLKLWSGLTFAEIASVLDLPPNTAASRYRYGLDKLRELLRPLYDEIRS